MMMMMMMMMIDNDDDDDDYDDDDENSESSPLKPYSRHWHVLCIFPPLYTILIPNSA